MLSKVINSTCDVTSLFLYSDAHRSHGVRDVARHMRTFWLIYRYRASYTTVSWFDVHWSGCFPDLQHCLVSQRLPTELFSSAPFLHGAIFLVFQERGGIKPHPIYGSFPCWSNRMIQKHSYMYRRAHKHKSVHMQPKTAQWHGEKCACACLAKKTTHTQADCASHPPAAWRLVFTLGRYWGPVTCTVLTLCRQVLCAAVF